jgi:Protein of unknown function (DUF1826)
MRLLIVLCLLKEGRSFHVSQAIKPTALFSQREDIKSFVYLESPTHESDCKCNHEMETSVRNSVNFDNSCNFKIDEIESMRAATSSVILPPAFLQMDRFREDVIDMIDLASKYAVPGDSISCRLALINGVRCPKWHEDSVKVRLIKTYYGQGTEWVDPTDLLIRANNCFRSYMDWDLEVKDEKKIKAARVNDILIISGKTLEDSSVVPVLHRSPRVNENERRLLFTVTIS